MKTFLIVNPGSTSIKYKIFNNKGNLIDKKNFDLKIDKEKKKEEKFLKEIKKKYSKKGLIISFRIVHGGFLKGPVILNKENLKIIKKFTIFAPIHNKIFIKKFNKIKKIFQKEYENQNFWAAFDTDFHQTIPLENKTYPINQNLAKKFNIKKYGFHGLAIESALDKIKKKFEKEKKELPSKLIFAHLGGGSSITAVKNGNSFITSMGLTPISGLMMTTRVGDVDSDLDKILARQMNKKIDFISELLSNKSGFFGLTGSKNTEEIFEKAKKSIYNKEKYPKEELAFKIYLNQIIEKIYAYSGLMGGLDFLIFSGGIGKGNSFLRKEVSKKLKLLNINEEKILAIDVDEEKIIFEKIRNLIHQNQN